MGKPFTFKLRTLFLSCAMLFISAFAHAQLATGDIAFVGINSDDPNELAIVTLASIASGQTIYITDGAWNGSALETSNTTAEGVIMWTTNKVVPAGTIIKFSIGSGAVITGGLAAFGTVSATGWSGDPIASGGDNWFILQGSIAAPAFIYAYANWGTAAYGVKTWPSTGVTFPNATVSYLPASLANGTTANIQSGDAAYHFDNNVYTGPKTGTKAAILAAIATSTNWTGNENTSQDINPGGTNFTGANPIFTVGTPPVITQQPLPGVVCSGNTTSFSIAATNATSFQWQFSTDGVNFTPLSNVAPYSGVTTSTLTITNATSALNNYQYRAVATGAGSATSNAASLTVKALPTVNQIVPAAICSGGTTNIPLVSTPAGATFTYEVPSETGVVGGAAGNTSPIAQTLFTTGFAAGATAVYSVTATLAGCTGAPRLITQSVNPLPVVNQVTPNAICSGTATNIILTSTPAGAAFTYTAPTLTGVTGGIAGTTSPIVQTLTATSSALGTAAYSVKATLYGCTGAATNITQTVNPLPDSSSVVTGSTIAAKQSGATYKWFSCGNTVNVLGTSQSFTPTASGFYNLTITANNCTAIGPCKYIDATITDVNESLLSNENLSIYPNPASNIFHITLLDAIDGQVTITDVNGKVVYANALTGTTTDIVTTDLSNGIYLLKVSSDVINTSQKIVIVK